MDTNNNYITPYQTFLQYCRPDLLSTPPPSFEMVTDIVFWEILLVVPVSLSSVVSENAGSNDETNADTSGKESCGKSIKRFTI